MQSGYPWNRVKVTVSIRSEKLSFHDLNSRGKVRESNYRRRGCSEFIFFRWPCVCVFIGFPIVHSESEAENLVRPTIKTCFSIKWHLKSKHFRVSEMPIRLLVTPHNNNDFNCKGSKDMATEITKKNRWFWPLHGRLGPPHHETPKNTLMDFTLPESRVHGLHFCHWKYESIFFEISTVSTERRIICAVECGTAFQGHPRSLILESVERACRTS